MIAPTFVVFLAAGSLSAGASLLAGAVGRSAGANITQDDDEFWSRWLGNFLAFSVPLFVVPTLALA